MALQHPTHNTKFSFGQQEQKTQIIHTNHTTTNINHYNKPTLLKFYKTARNTNDNRSRNKNKLHKKIQKNLQEKSIINLSNKSLSKTTLTTLAKGLTFSPTPKPTKYQQIYTSLLKYRKSMCNRYHFRHTQPRRKHPFKLPTKFTAPPPDNSNLQEYISNILYDLKTGYTDSRQSNPKT